MDYRSSLADDEHSAGASPWGSPPASPHHQPPAQYGSLASEANYGYDTAQDPSNGMQHADLTANAFAQPTTASGPTPATEDAPSQSHEESQQSSFGGPPQQNHSTEAPGFGAGNDAAHQQQQQHQYQQQQQQQGQAPEGGMAAGQQGQQPQARKPAYPQYKLQAKISGLERTGRKDPILRFDVHVQLPPLSAVPAYQS